MGPEAVQGIRHLACSMLCAQVPFIIRSDNDEAALILSSRVIHLILRAAVP